MTDVERVNELVRYHGDISRVMTAERTSLESGLIPVTAYILVSVAEAFFRYPDMMATIDAALPAEEIGLHGRRPGSRVNAVYHWSIANFFLLGRQVGSMVAPELDSPERTLAVLDFWERSAKAYRGDGNRQAWDAGMVLRPYGNEVIDELLAGVDEVDDVDQRAELKRFNATVMNYLFLLYFDTRVGTGDTGPYELPGGRVLLVRDFYRLGQSDDFWWSDVAAGVPYQHLVAALVLDGVKLKVNDWGTSITEPEDYLDALVGFGLYTTDGGGPQHALRPVPLDELDGIVTSVRTAQAALYRRIAAMDRAEKIRCGAYVYFSFLRPFADVAGVTAELDWDVPRDTVGPLYDMLEGISGGSAGGSDGPYYAPYEPGP